MPTDFTVVKAHDIEDMLTGERTIEVVWQAVDNELRFVSEYSEWVLTHVVWRESWPYPTGDRKRRLELRGRRVPKGRRQPLSSVERIPAYDVVATFVDLCRDGRIGEMDMQPRDSMRRFGKYEIIVMDDIIRASMIAQAEARIVASAESAAGQELSEVDKERVLDALTDEQKLRYL